MLAPHYWCTESPNQLQMMLSMPFSKHKKHRMYDMSNAYGTCLLDNAIPFDKSRAEDRVYVDWWISQLTKDDYSTLCVVKINGELIMCIGCPQGLGPVALFWNIHFSDALYFIFFKFWIKMFCSFVDD